MDWSFSTMDWSIAITVFCGAISGYVASRILGGDGYGFLGNIVVGVIGGFIGTWIVKIKKFQLLMDFLAL
ncbi:MAG: hypothetical protein R2771_03965 [Saprospiraceae bacterium]